MPLYLEELADALDEKPNDAARAARIHGKQRAHAAYSLGDLVMEIGLARTVTIEHLPPGTERKQLRLVDVHFDRMMKEAAEEFIDQSERRQREDALFRDRILGVLSHDLRNPLQAISMGLDLVLRDRDLRTATRRAAERAESSAARMRRMIRDLLDFTRTQEGGALRLQCEPLDVRALCDEIVEELRIANPGRDIEVTASGRTRGEWDRDRLAQVVSNLVGNALEHGEPGTPITVSIFGESEAGPAIEVTNRGQPIPASNRKAIFEAFRRGVDAPRHNGNLGLGLFIAQRIVEAHDGSLALTKSDGTTTFTVRLPWESESR